jgi:hypothetical protein
MASATIARNGVEMRVSIRLRRIDHALVVGRLGRSPGAVEQRSARNLSTPVDLTGPNRDEIDWKEAEHGVFEAGNEAEIGLPSGFERGRVRWPFFKQPIPSTRRKPGDDR